MMIYLEVAIKGTLVLSVAGCVVLSLRSRTAATRHLVWSVAAIVVLLLPALLAVAPRNNLGVPEGSTLAGLMMRLPPAARELASDSDDDQRPDEPTTGAVDDQRSAEPAADEPPRGITDAPQDRPRRLPSETLQEAAGPAVTGAHTSAGRPGARPPAAEPGEGERTVAWNRESGAAGVAPVALAIWIIGAAFVLIALVIERVRLTFVARRARAATDPRSGSHLRRLCREAGVRREPRLRIGARNVMPMTWGTLRPFVLLPEDSLGWSDRRLDAVLRHELAHVRRRDDLTQVLATIMAALHWFDPLAWIALRCMRIEREHACDDEVLRHGVTPSAYAQDLLDIARGFRVARATTLAAQAMARRSRLARRLVAVLEESRLRRPLRRGHVIAALGVGLVLAAPLATLAVTIVPTTPTAIWNPVPLGAGEPSPARAQDPASACWQPGVDREASNIHHTGSGLWTYTWISDRCRGEIRLDGELRFDDAFVTITGISPGGSFRIEVEEGGTERRVDISVGTDGQPVFEWRVDGQRLAFEPDGRRWLDAILPQVFRATGVAAEPRAAALYAQGGADAVFREVALMESNSTMSRYLAALARQPRIDDADLVRLLGVARTRIDSNSSKARVLGVFARERRDTILSGEVGDAFWEAAHSIDSNSTTARLLLGMVVDEPQDSPLVGRVLEEAGERIDSNSTLAELLLDLRRAFPGITAGGPYRDLYWRSLDHIDSNSTLARLLLEIAAGTPADSALQPVVLQTARTRLTSNSTLAEFLLAIERRNPGITESGPLTEEFWATVRRIDSDSTLSSLLLELAAGKPSDSRTLDLVIVEARQRIGSSSQKGRFLVAFSGQHLDAVTGRLRDEVLAAAREIGSRSTRERTLRELQDLGIEPS